MNPFTNVMSSLHNLLGGMPRPEPDEPTWYDRAIQAIKAGLASEGLDEDTIELLWELNARIKGIVRRHEELRDSKSSGFVLTSPKIDADAKKLRNAVVNLSRGKPLNYYDRKLLEELCSVLADIRASKTQFVISGVEQVDDKLHVHVDLKPVNPIEYIEVDFTVIPSETHGETTVMSTLDQAITNKVVADVERDIAAAMRAQTPDANRNQWTPVALQQVSKHMQSQLQSNVFRPSAGQLRAQGAKQAHQVALEQLARQSSYYSSAQSMASASNTKESA